MKFLDRILGVLGFDVEEDFQKKPKKQKGKNKEVNFQESKEKVHDVNAQKQETNSETFPMQNVSTTQNILQNQKENSIKVLNVVPQNQNEVQDAMDALKSGKNVIIDLSVFKASDILRALDFISGVCYCLNARIQRLGETTFALTLQNNA